MTKREAYIDELTTALELFEKAAVPGGGGHGEAIKACIHWENTWRIYSSSLDGKMRKEYRERADKALADAMG